MLAKNIWIIVFVLLSLLTCTNYDSFTNQQQNLLDANVWEYTFESLEGAKKADIRSRDGLLDFSDILALPNNNLQSLIAKTRILSARADYSLSIKAKGKFELWLDNRLIFQNYQPFEFPVEQEELWLSLSAGLHQLVLKSKQDQVVLSVQLNLRQLDAKNTVQQQVSYRSIQLGFARPSPVSATDTVNFRARISPASDVVFPLIWSLKDNDEKVIAQGLTVSGVWNSVAIPKGKDQFLRLFVEYDQSAQTIFKPKNIFLRSPSAWRLFSHGNFDKLAAEVSKKARTLSELLPSSLVNDWKPTLAYLADRIDGRLPASLLSPELIEQAVAFAEDILKAYAKEQSIANVFFTQYRQMAWSSAIDGSVQPYSLYLPSNYSKTRSYKLLVFLHGFGQNDYDAVKALAETLPEDFIIVSPYARGDMYYKLMAEQEVLDLLDHVLGRYSIDKNRLYMAGESMGGFGAWQMAQNFNDKFVSVSAFMGGGNPALAENLRNLQVFAAHGSADEIVNVSFSRNIVEELRKKLIPVRYDELPSVGHHALGSWLDSYGATNYFSFLRELKYQDFISHISAYIASARYGSQHWLSVDEIDHSDDELAHIEAKRLASDRITIKTKKIKALKLDLNKGLINKEKILDLSIDGNKLRFEPIALKEASIHLYRAQENVSWQQEAIGNEDRVRHDESGLAGLFSKKLIVIYGTKNSSEARLKSNALLLADWGIGMLHDSLAVKLGKFRVISDREFSQDMIEEYNIILVGDESQNSVTQLMNDHPLSLWKSIYANNVFKFQDSSFVRPSLSLVQPNPYNQRKLLALFNISDNFFSSPEQRLAWFRDFKYWLCGYKPWQSRRSLTINQAIPDVMIFGSEAYSPLWKGWYDRNWRNLYGK